MKEKGQKSAPTGGAGGDRDERLAKALRENLRRRKGLPAGAAQTPSSEERADDAAE